MIHDPRYANDELYQIAALGIDAEHFKNYDKLGRYLYAKALDSRAVALEQLGEIDPSKTEEIRELQMRARIPLFFQQWLDEAIAEGKAAEMQIELEDSE